MFRHEEPVVTPAVREALLECLTEYFDQHYEGEPIPSWVEVLGKVYAETVGAPATEGPVFWHWLFIETLNG